MLKKNTLKLYNAQGAIPKQNTLGGKALETHTQGADRAPTLSHSAEHAPFRLLKFTFKTIEFAEFPRSRGSGRLFPACPRPHTTLWPGAPPTKGAAAFPQSRGGVREKPRPTAYVRRRLGTAWPAASRSITQFPCHTCRRALIGPFRKARSFFSERRGWTRRALPS